MVADVPWYAAFRGHRLGKGIPISLYACVSSQDDQLPRTIAPGGKPERLDHVGAPLGWRCLSSFAVRGLFPLRVLHDGAAFPNVVHCFIGKIPQTFLGESRLLAPKPAWQPPCCTGGVRAQSPPLCFREGSRMLGGVSLYLACRVVRLVVRTPAEIPGSCASSMEDTWSARLSPTPESRRSGCWMSEDGAPARCYRLL